MEIFVQNNTSKKISSEKIVGEMLSFLEAHKASNNSEVSVVIVDRYEMLKYVEKYLHETGEEAAAHPVLSFVQNEIEGPFQNPPDNINHLGEIIVSIDHAKSEKELLQLIKHGALHLLGIHHK